MDNTGITPVMPVGGMGDGFNGGGFAWIFGLIVLLALFNGGFGGNNGNSKLMITAKTTANLPSA